MKEITTQRVITEVTGYEANDGTFFNTKEECRKYEQSAEAAITKMFYDICVKVCGEAFFSEGDIWGCYGNCNDDYRYVIVDIKSETELKIANMFSDMRCPKHGKKLSTDYIGKRILISIGSDDWDPCFSVKGTEDELIEGFKRTIGLFFRPEEN